MKPAHRGTHVGAGFYLHERYGWETKGHGLAHEAGGGNLILSGTSTYTGVTSVAAGAAALLAAIGMGLAAHRAIRRRRLLY